MNEVTIHVKTENRTDMDAIGKKVEASAKKSFLRTGGHSGAAFAAGFIKTVTLGMVGSGFAQASMKLAPVMAHIGGTAGVLMAAALAAKLAKTLSAVLPLALGGGILAGPIMYLVKTQEKAIDRLKKKAKSFMDEISRPVKVPFLKSLEMIGDKLSDWGPKLRKAIGPLAKELPGFVKGGLKGIQNFAEEIGKKMPSITRGFRQWGKELPGIGKALGKMVADWIESGPELVQGIQDTAGSMRDLAHAVGAVGRGFRALEKTGKKKGGFFQTSSNDLSEFSQEFALWKARTLEGLAKVAEAWAKINPMMRKPAKALREMANAAHDELDKVKRNFASTQNRLNNAKIVPKVKADIKDLQSKVRDAKQRLRETHNQKTQAKIRADIHDLQAKIAAARARLRALNGQTATTYIRTVYKGINKRNQGAPFHAAGGIVGGQGAATGGNRGGAQVMVGEEGPELVDLPFGSHVNSNPDTQRMMSGSKGGSGGPHLHFHFDRYTGSTTDLIKDLVNAKKRGQLDVLFR